VPSQAGVFYGWFNCAVKFHSDVAQRYNVLVSTLTHAVVYALTGIAQGFVEVMLE
jgi:hypothetical protein